MDKKTLERNSTGSSKNYSHPQSNGRVSPGISKDRLQSSSRSQRRQESNENIEDEIQEDAKMSPRTKANQEAVFKKLRLFYQKKYPEFQVGKYLYKEENIKKRSNSMETGYTETFYRSSTDKNGQNTGFDDYDLMEKVKKMKQLKGGKYVNKKYEKVTSKVDSGVGSSPRSPPTKVLSIDSSPSSLRRERIANMRGSQGTFNLNEQTHTFGETSMDLNDSRRDLHAPPKLLPIIRAHSINHDYVLPSTKNPSPSLSFTKKEIKGRVGRSQTFNLSRPSPSPILKAVHHHHESPMSKLDLMSDMSKQSPEIKRINQFTYEMIPEFDNMSPVQQGIMVESTASPMTNSPDLLYSKAPSNYSPVLSAITDRKNLKKRGMRMESFSLDKPQGNLLSQSVSTKSPPKKVRADPLLQIKNDFNKIKQNMNQTYTEVKEKTVPAKLDWMVYHTHKDYNKIERRLGSTRPRLYNFEDYIKSVYGKSYSTDEYGMAMKPHRLAVNPEYNNAKRDRDLRELIDQVKKEGFDIVEK